MKKILILCLVFFMVFPIFALSSELQYSHTAGLVEWGSFGQVTSTKFYSCSWNVSNSGQQFKLDKLNVAIGKDGTPPNSVFISVYSAFQNKTPNQFIANSTNYALNADIDAAGSFFMFNFENQTLQSDTQYTIVYGGVGYSNAPNRWMNMFDDNTGSKQSSWGSVNTGASLYQWTTEWANGDCGLEVYGNNYTIPSIRLDFFSISPINNTVLNTNNFNISYIPNASKITIENCSLYIDSIINSTDISVSNTNVNYFNNTYLGEDSYLWEIKCVSNNSVSYSTGQFNITIDQSPPYIFPDYYFENNLTIVYNGTLAGYINFSDDREIYSVNVTFNNGSTLFYQANIDNPNYNLNISVPVTEVPIGSILAEVCDSHTAKQIDDIKNKKEGSGLKFIIKENFLFQDIEWVKIYPEDKLNYDDASTSKSIDRYSFDFNKKNKPKYDEVFIVESSNYIDIILNSDYIAHLVIPSIGGKGYWVDFENEEVEYWTVERISDTKVKVHLFGLTSKNIVFNSIGELNCESRTLWYNNINTDSNYQTGVLAGDIVQFDLNIDKVSNILQTQNATLHFLGTDYYAGSSDNFSINVTMPSSIVGVSQTFSFYWSMNLNGKDITLANQTILVYDFDIDNCTNYNMTSLNFSIYNEYNGSLISADISGLFNFSYLSNYKTYTLNAINVPTQQICILPGYASLLSDYLVYYGSSTYPQRRYYASDILLNNQTVNIKLFLLESTMGIYARFRVVDRYNTPISYVTGTMKGFVGSTEYTLEQETTDGSGLATFWVNPDEDYTFYFVKDGYTTFSVTLRPTTSDIYTITLDGGSTTTRDISQSIDTKYYFYPTTDLLNNTNYTFRFNLTTGNTWNITSCTLYIKDSNGNILTSGSSFSKHLCSISLTYNTGTYDSLISQAIYSLNDTDSQTVQKSYNVAYSYSGDFSLKSFIDELRSFSGAGFNDFTRMVIAFLVIFVIMGLIIQTSGITDPEGLIGLMMFLVVFLSYIGFLTLNLDTIPTDWLKQYMIALLVCVGGGAYIIKRHTD